MPVFKCEESDFKVKVTRYRDYDDSTYKFVISGTNCAGDDHRVVRGWLRACDVHKLLEIVQMFFDWSDAPNISVACDLLVEELDFAQATFTVTSGEFIYISEYTTDGVTEAHKRTDATICVGFDELRCLVNALDYVSDKHSHDEM